MTAGVGTDSFESPTSDGGGAPSRATSPGRTSAHEVVNPGLPVPHLDGISHRWVEARNESFHIAETATPDEGAPVVVLLHGWPQHWWCWRKVIPDLVADARVVALDLRGHGWSSAPDNGYLKEEMVDDLFGVLDELGLDRVTLVGHDWGGWIGFLAALRHPERFDALVALAIIHPFQQLSLRTISNAWRGAYQPVLASPVLGRSLLTTQPWVLSEMIKRGTHDHDAIDPSTRRQYAELLRSPARASASVQMYRTFLLHELPHLGRYRHEHLTVPTHLLVGRADPVANEAFLGGWQEHATDMTVECIDDVGHFIPEEDPARVVDAVTTILSRNDIGPRT